LVPDGAARAGPAGEDNRRLTAATSSFTITQIVKLEC